MTPRKATTATTAWMVRATKPQLTATQTIQASRRSNCGSACRQIGEEGVEQRFLVDGSTVFGDGSLQ
jgi:hypothetical protein